MVTLNDLLNLSKKSLSTFALSDEELIAFVKAGAIRAYKAKDPARATEEVEAEFNAQTKELKLCVRKKVVDEVKDAHKECTQAQGKAAVGETATLEVDDKDTYKAVDAAVEAMRCVIESTWKKQNALLVKTKYQELKEKCVITKVVNSKTKPVVVHTGGVDLLLPQEEQIPQETLSEGVDILVYVEELRETNDAADIIVSRSHAGLVAYAVRRHIPEVDLGSVDIKGIARIAGKRSRVAVHSKDLAAVERCEKKTHELKEELGEELVDFIEWYADPKAYIVSALKVQAREVHIIESEKQAQVEVFRESADQCLDKEGIVLKLAQELTGYTIGVSVVAKDEKSDLPAL